MDKILDMIAKWDHLGQGFFFLCVIGATYAAIVELWTQFVILCRGRK